MTSVLRVWEPQERIEALIPADSLLQSMQLRYHQEGPAGLWETHLEEEEEEKEEARLSRE